MLMLISAPGVNCKLIGSLSTGAPAGISIELRRSNVTFRMDSSLIVEAFVGIATVAAPIKRGDEPNSFEKRSRIWLPPMDARTRSRTVRLSILSRGSRGFGLPDCGLVAQVAIQAFGEAA